MAGSLGRNRREDENRKRDVESPPHFGTIATIPTALRQLGRRIRIILSRRRSNNELPLGHGNRFQVLASHLSKVSGSSLIFCSIDGEPLFPIVHANDCNVEVIGCACLSCHKFFPTLAGILTDRLPTGVH